jgi:hypothetical protein
MEIKAGVVKRASTSPVMVMRGHEMWSLFIDKVSRSFSRSVNERWSYQPSHSVSWSR